MHRHAERFEVLLAERPLRYFHVIVFTARIHRSITGKMFQTSGNAGLRYFSASLLIITVSLLISPEHYCAHDPAKERIFPERFHYPSPSRVSGHIHHRRKRGLDPLSSRLCRGMPRHLLNQFRMKGTCLTKRDRSYGPAPVYNIRHKQQRNVMRMFFHIFFLDRPELFCPDHTKH